MTRRLALAAVLVALMNLVVVPAGSAQPPKRGGVLRIAEREAPSLDPYLTISFLTHSHINLAYGPSVKGFRHHDGYGLGYRLMYTWLDR